MVDSMGRKEWEREGDMIRVIWGEIERYRE